MKTLILLVGFWLNPPQTNKEVASNKLFIQSFTPSSKNDQGQYYYTIQFSNGRKEIEYASEREIKQFLLKGKFEYICE